MDSRPLSLSLENGRKGEGKEGKMEREVDKAFKTFEGCLPSSLPQVFVSHLFIYNLYDWQTESLMVDRRSGCRVYSTQTRQYDCLRTTIYT